MLTEDEKQPQGGQELNGSLTRQFDNSVASAIGRKVEPFIKWTARLASMLVVWLAIGIYQRIDAIPELKRQLGEVEAKLDAIKDIPSRVAMLEKDRDNTLEAQRRSEEAQRQILAQLAELRGFISGINAQKKEPTK